MCHRSCVSKCVLTFGLGLIVASFTEGGFAVFLVGAAVIILSFTLKEK